MALTFALGAPMLHLLLALDPSPSQEALYKALSGRDGAPSCESLESLSTNLPADLIFLTENAKKPAWVGVRAAECLVRRHPTEAAATIETWLTTENNRGFAILATQEFDQLPAETALRFAKIALEGPLAETLRPRLARSIHPEVVSLSGPATPLRATEGVE